MGKLLTEQNFSNVQNIIESVGTTKKYKIKGIFAQAEKPNKNKRRYPQHILEREIDRYSLNYVKENRAIGEIGHPDSPQINLDRVSHKITSLVKEGNNFFGVAEIIDTRCGNDVKALLDAGVKLGVSTRGVGSLKPTNEGLSIVGEDFFLSTIDIVADPSAPDAFVSAIRESKDWVLIHGNWTEVERDATKKALMEARAKDYESIALHSFSRFLQGLRL